METKCCFVAAALCVAPVALASKAFCPLDAPDDDLARRAIMRLQKQIDHQPLDGARRTTACAGCPSAKLG
jgi:hypothetical protein